MLNKEFYYYFMTPERRKDADGGRLLVIQVVGLLLDVVRGRIVDKYYHGGILERP